jgi:hypothetical protein
MDLLRLGPDGEAEVRAFLSRVRSDLGIPCGDEHRPAGRAPPSLDPLLAPIYEREVSGGNLPTEMLEDSRDVHPVVVMLHAQLDFKSTEYAGLVGPGIDRWTHPSGAQQGYISSASGHLLLGPVALRPGRVELEQFYSGDEAWRRFVELSPDGVAEFEGEGDLLRLLSGDRDLVRVCVAAVGEAATDWVVQTQELLDGLTPVECASSPDLHRRLREFLMRMP